MKSQRLKIKRSISDVADDPVIVLKAAHQKLKQAEVLRQNRSVEAAEKICLSLLQKFPNYYGALHTAGLVFADKGDHEQAMLYLVQAAKVNPHSWTTLTALTGVYLALNATEMASRTLRDALEITTKEPTIYVTLAEVYYEQREYVLALEACQNALGLDPEIEEALITMSRACVALGRYVEARKALDLVAKIKPPSLNLLIQLSHLPASYIGQDLISELEQLENKVEKVDQKHKLASAFIRATAYDNKKQYAKAWQWAVEANALAGVDVRNETEQELKSVEHRVNWMTNNKSKYMGNRNTDKYYPASVFILGLSRSGKTTAESLLSSQKAVFRGYENPAINRAVEYAYHTGALIAYKSIAQLPYQLYPLVRDRYSSLVNEMAGDQKIFTNTSPGHIWDAPIFSQAIPNVKFVFIKRNFFDLSLRIFMKNYRSGHYYSYDLKSIERYVKAYNQMIDLMSETHPDDSIIVNYEDMMTDPNGVLDQMCGLCGIDPDHSLLPEIADDTGCSEPYMELIKATLEDH